MWLSALMERLKVYARKGDKKNTQATIQEILQLMGPSANAQQRRSVQNALESTVCCCNGDVPGYLKLASEFSNGLDLHSAILQGKLSVAAGLAANQKDDASQLNPHALLHLAALKAGDKKIADEQWQALLKDLAQAGGHERLLGDMLAGRKPAKADLIRRLHIEPEKKRVLLVVASKRLPESAKELVQLALRLGLLARSYLALSAKSPGIDEQKGVRTHFSCRDQDLKWVLTPFWFLRDDLFD